MSQVQNSVQNTAPVADENQLIAERRDKLKNLRAAQAVAFPNDFKPADRAADLLAALPDNAYRAALLEMAQAAVLRRI